MNVIPQNRLMNRVPRKSMISHIVDEAGYVILALVALWASARFNEWSEQFIALAIILGWKWICNNQTQVIQIINYDSREY